MNSGVDLNFMLMLLSLVATCTALPFRKAMINV